MNMPDRLDHATPWLLFALIVLALCLAVNELVRDRQLRATAQPEGVDEKLLLGLLLLAVLSVGAFAITITY